MFNFFQSDLPTGSEVIEVEEDNTISVGGEGYKVVIDNGPQESLEKRKGKLAKTVIHIYPTFYFYDKLLQSIDLQEHMEQKKQEIVLGMIPIFLLSYH